VISFLEEGAGRTEDPSHILGRLVPASVDRDQPNATELRRSSQISETMLRI
jgi:hypothetical protein